MRVVLDTSSLIYLNDFRGFDEIFTVNSVIREVKDKVTLLKLASLRLKIIEPKSETIKEIENTARETMDFEKLSRTDIEVLASAKENNCTIISDDRNIQNVAEKLGIGYVSIFNKKITKLITWKKYCNSCKKYFAEGKDCSICGEKLSRVPEASIEIK
ncbi:MAG TPA: hypothetical protein VJ343_00340 [archaeon]|nr:hypothetical protein [archaeon]